MNRRKRTLPAVVVGVAAFASFFLIVQTILASSSSPLQSQVKVGNAAPSASSVILNGGASINLTANTTTPINVTAIWSDANGCNDIKNGTETTMVYRTGVGSSTCIGSASNLNCYVATVLTASSTCTGQGTSVNTTTTFNIYYLAQATDASSSFSSDSWIATMDVTDPSGATGTADSATTSLITLNAINVTTSSINYGTLAASSTSASAQTTTVQNAGNSSTSLELSATAFSSTAATFATSSQHYATSSFTYGTADTAISDVASQVSGFLLTSPTTTVTHVAGDIFWEVGVPAGTASGTYNATTTFLSLFHS
jgi:hypothetical protein